MKIEGSFKGVCEVKDNLRKYIAKAIVGGRVCVNKKYLKKIVNKKGADYDGVSLYPSAIARLCKESGLPTGPAYKLLDFNQWDKVHYSIMEIKITSS